MKKILIPLLVVVILALIGGLAYLFMNLQEQKQVNRDMQELAMERWKKRAAATRKAAKTKEVETTK